MEYSTSRHPTHNYRSRCFYLITLNKKKGVGLFSTVVGGKDFPAPSPGVRVSEIGASILNRINAIQTNYPNVKIWTKIIMPDHVHFVLEFTRDAPFHLGNVISRFKYECGRATIGQAIFEKGYHDRILRHRNQLTIMNDYVMDNPRRWIVRTEHPDFFGKPMSLEMDGRNYAVYGNFLLLRDPCISPVIISSSYSNDELERWQKEWEEIIRVNGVLVSPFISQSEKEVMRKAINNGGSIVLITREPIRERFKPYGELFDLCAEGRLLIISTMNEANTAKLTKSEARKMNALAERISKGAIPELKLRSANSSKRRN